MHWGLDILAVVTLTGLVTIPVRREVLDILSLAGDQGVLLRDSRR